MLLEIACQKLGWPSHDEVLRPKAAGPRHYANRVAQKIGEVLARSMSDVEVTTCKRRTKSAAGAGRKVKHLLGS